MTCSPIGRGMGLAIALALLVLAGCDRAALRDQQAEVMARQREVQAELRSILADLDEELGRRKCASLNAARVRSGVTNERWRPERTTGGDGWQCVPDTSNDPGGTARGE